MHFRQLFDKTSSTYTYLLGCGETKKAIIIDPVIDNIEQYLQLLKQLDLTLSVAIDTHIHADHVSALGELRNQLDCRTVMGEHSDASCVSEKVQHDQLIQEGGVKLKALYTPGHTKESYSFYCDGKVFTGDALLIRGTGRTDFQGGDAGMSWDSIQDQLLSLPDETLIFPGHDYKGWTTSSVLEEKMHNPRLANKNRDDYIDIMNNLNLSDPKMMDLAVPANLQCGDLKD